MADEAKIIVEAVGLDGGAGASSAGDKLRTEEKAKGQPSPADGVQALIEAISKGESTPLGADVNSVLEEISKTKRDLLAARTAVTVEQVAAPNNVISQASTAEFGGSGGLPPIPPPPAGATVPTSAGEVSGSIAAGATTEAAVATTGFASALISAVPLIGKAAAIFGVVTVAVTAFADFLADTIKSLAAEWQGVSGTMNMAEARRDVALTQERLATEENVAPAYTQITAAQTELEKTVIDIKAYLIDLLGPSIATIVTIANGLLEVISASLEAIVSIRDFGAKIFNAIVDFFSWSKWVRSWFSGGERPEQEDVFAQILMNELGSAAAAGTTRDSKAIYYKQFQPPKRLPPGFAGE